MTPREQRLDLMDACQRHARNLAGLAMLAENMNLASVAAAIDRSRFAAKAAADELRKSIDSG